MNYINFIRNLSPDLELARTDIHAFIETVDDSVPDVWIDICDMMLSLGRMDANRAEVSLWFAVAFLCTSERFIGRLPASYLEAATIWWSLGVSETPNWSLTVPQSPNVCKTLLGLLHSSSVDADTSRFQWKSVQRAMKFQPSESHRIFDADDRTTYIAPAMVMSLDPPRTIAAERELHHYGRWAARTVATIHDEGMSIATIRHIQHVLQNGQVAKFIVSYNFLLGLAAFLEDPDVEQALKQRYRPLISEFVNVVVRHADPSFARAGLVVAEMDVDHHDGHHVLVLTIRHRQWLPVPETISELALFSPDVYFVRQGKRVRCEFLGDAPQILDERVRV